MMSQNPFPVRLVIGCAALLMIAWVGMTAFNKWMDRQLAGAGQPQKYYSPAAFQPALNKMGHNPYGSNVKIDPSNDPLAPVAKTVPSKKAVVPDNAAPPEPEYEAAPTGEILVQ